MRRSNTIVLWLTVTFLVAEFFGYAVQTHYTKVSLPFGLTPPPVSEEQSVGYFIAMMIVATIVFFIIIKYALFLLWKIWYILAVTLCSAVSLRMFLNDNLALIAAFFSAVLSTVERDVYFYNMVQILCYAGLASIFSPIFNIGSMIILLVIISVYDFISVYVTGHMVTLAKTQEKTGIVSGVVVKDVEKNESAFLGGGDLVLPMLFSGVAGRTNIVSGYFIIYGATVSLLFLLLMGEKKKAYPAMPVLSTGMLIGYIISLFF